VSKKKNIGVKEKGTPVGRKEGLLGGGIGFQVSVPMKKRKDNWSPKKSRRKSARLAAQNHRVKKKGCPGGKKGSQQLHGGREKGKWTELTK